jgi:hypothetical protein
MGHVGDGPGVSGCEHGAAAVVVGVLQRDHTRAGIVGIDRPYGGLNVIRTVW